jgi:hypothetical protein
VKSELFCLWWGVSYWPWKVPVIHYHVREENSALVEQWPTRWNRRNRRKTRPRATFSTIVRLFSTWEAKITCHSKAQQDVKNYDTFGANQYNRISEQTISQCQKHQPKQRHDKWEQCRIFTNFHEIWCLRISLKSVEKIQISLNPTRIIDILHEDLWMELYDRIPLNYS